MSRNIKLVTFSSFISYVGNAMQFIALAWYITRVFKSPTYLGMFVLIGSIATILSTPFAAFLADQGDNKKVIILSDIARFIIMIFMILILMLEHVKSVHLLGLIFLIEFLLNVGSTIFYPSFIALIKSNFKEKDFAVVTSYNSISLQMGALIGTTLSGVVVSSYGIVIVLCINAFSYLISAISLLDFKTSSLNAKKSISISEITFPKFFDSTVKSVKVVFRYKIVLYLVLLGILPSLVTKLINIFLAGYSYNTLHVSPTIFGVLDGATAVGAIFWSYFLKKSEKILSFTNIWFFELLIGASLLCLSVSRNTIVVILIMFVLGGSTIIFSNIRRIFFFKKIDKELIGSLESLNSMIYSVLIPFIAFIISSFTKSNDIPKTFMIIGIIYIILSTVIFKTNKKI